MSAQRKYYLFAAVVFCIGAVIAVAGGAYTALFVFLVLAATMFGVQARVDTWIETRRPSDRPGARRE